MIRTSTLTLIFIAFSILSSFAQAADFSKGDEVLLRCGLYFYKGEVTKKTSSGKLKLSLESPTQNALCARGFKDPEMHTILKYQSNENSRGFSIGTEVLAKCLGAELDGTVADLTNEYIRIEFNDEIANKVCGPSFKDIQLELDGERLEIL